jgi:hypothetical protein
VAARSAVAAQEWMMARPAACASAKPVATARPMPLYMGMHWHYSGELFFLVWDTVDFDTYLLPPVTRQTLPAREKS